MKNILILLIGVLCSNSIIAQQVSLADVNITLPYNAVKLNPDQLKSFSKTKGYDIRTIQFNPKNVYKIGDVLFAFYDFKSNPADTDIQKEKVGLDWLYKRNAKAANYSSSIETINNFKVVITKHIYQSLVTYSFFSLNNKRTAVLNGILQFSESDKTLGDNTFEGI